MKRILVIGNGFDLAHGLPTRYTDFLDFYELFTANKEEFNCKLQNMTPQEREAKDEFIIRVKACRNKYLHNFKQNNLIKYFSEPNNCREKWVDFESLLEVYINNINKYFQTQRIEDRYLLPNHIKELIRNNNDKKNSEIKKIVYDYLRKDLDELIDCLDFYFNQVVYKTDILMYPADMYPKEKYLSQRHKYGLFDCILSFNYTDVYNRVCKKLGILQIHQNFIHYIHGQTGLNNIVLGIADSEPQNLDMIYFKKYFQRIQKHTGIKYEVWINSDSLVVFMGHSMDPTDGDIIKKLITNTQQTIIYYYDQSDYEQKIINLIKIFGANIFEKLYYERKLVFTKLSPSIELQDNLKELQTTI